MRRRASRVHRRRGGEVVRWSADDEEGALRGVGDDEGTGPGEGDPARLGEPRRESAELHGSVPNWYQIKLPNGVEGFVSKRWTRVVPAATPVGTPSFTVDVVDVGTGLAVLVRGADFTLVYDAGSNDDDAVGDNNRMLAFMRAAAPTLNRIDHLVLSHPHTDHVSLMPDLLTAYEVRHVYDSGRLNDICGYRLFFAAVRARSDSRIHLPRRDAPRVRRGGSLGEPVRRIRLIGRAAPARAAP